MKTFKEILEQNLIENDQTFFKISKNIKDEIDIYKISKNKMDKKYHKVLVDINSVINKRKKNHNKDDVMSWNDLKDIILSSKAFKEYNKDKMTDESDFKHMMNY